MRWDTWAWNQLIRWFIYMDCSLCLFCSISFDADCCFQFVFVVFADPLQFHKYAEQTALWNSNEILCSHCEWRTPCQCLCTIYNLLLVLREIHWAWWWLNKCTAGFAGALSYARCVCPTIWDGVTICKCNSAYMHFVRIQQIMSKVRRTLHQKRGICKNRMCLYRFGHFSFWYMWQM